MEKKKVIKINKPPGDFLRSMIEPKGGIIIGKLKQEKSKEFDRAVAY